MCPLQVNIILEINRRSEESQLSEKSITKQTSGGDQVNDETKRNARQRHQVVVLLSLDSLILFCPSSTKGLTLHFPTSNKQLFKSLKNRTTVLLSLDNGITELIGGALEGKRQSVIDCIYFLCLQKQVVNTKNAYFIDFGLAVQVKRGKGSCAQRKRRRKVFSVQYSF